MRSSHKRNGSRGSSPAIQPGNAVVRRLRFRHLLEEKGIGKLFGRHQPLPGTGRMYDAGRQHRRRRAELRARLREKRGEKRDPEMHPAKRGNQRHFGMKCHTGVGAGSGFVHTVEATAANVRDVTAAAGLLREDDKAVCGDSACLGIEKREEIKSNPQLSAIAYRINRRPGRLPRGSDNAIDRERHIENQKSAVPFPVPGWRPYALHLR